MARRKFLEDGPKGGTKRGRPVARAPLGYDDGESAHDDAREAPARPAPARPSAKPRPRDGAPPPVRRDGSRPFDPRRSGGSRPFDPRRSGGSRPFDPRRARGERPRDDRPRPADDRGHNRARSDRPRFDRPPRANERPRDDRPRSDRPRDARPPFDRPRRDDRRRPPSGAKPSPGTARPPDRRESRARRDDPNAPVIAVRTWRRPAPARATTAAGGLSVLYEDAEVLAVDKPAGINVAIENEGESVSSLQSLASDYLATKNEGSALLGPRARLVHRIDKDTSGVVLLAKTPRAQSMLGREWEGGRVEKVYLAIVRGAPEYESGMVDAPIGRDPDRKNLRSVGGLEPQEARTRVKLVERLGGGFSLVEARPLTGRTHQIRVHLASIGCPLAIDPLYAARDAKKPPEIHRLTLHAKALTVPLPKNGRPHTIEAPIPDDFRRALEALRALPPEAPPAPPAKKARARRKR